MNSAVLSREMIDALEAVSVGPGTASEIAARPGALLSLSLRGLVESDRKPNHPNIYRATAKGEALIELLNSPLVLIPQDGAIANIQRVVARHFRTPVQEMWSARRSRGVARPRQVAMYFARELTPMSLPAIGRRFGKRDHTTVIHAINTVERLVATDRAFAADIAAVREALAK